MAVDKVRLHVLDADADDVDFGSVTGSIDREGHRRRIVPADVRGRFATARKIIFVFLIALWAALPWIKVKGAPAVLLDVDARRFYLFGLTFNAQDAWLLFFIASGAAFALVYATALAGRVWCGYACPQTVFLEGLFRRVERIIEGSREERMREVNGKRSALRGLRSIAKHVAFVVLAAFVAHIVLSYFVSLPKAWAMVRHSPAEHPEAFAWVTGITAALYLNFVWFREQMCLILCPYGRMQSMLLDDDSLVIGYDQKRGEPRGKKGKTTGDCVDCNRCVVVCPTGIDIRKGLQLDCIACSQCVDACDDVMDRLRRPRGLVRYDSQNGLAGKTKRIARPRLYLYTAMLFVGAAVTAFAMRQRTDFEVNVTRLAGAPYTVADGQVRNAFDLHVVNKRGEDAAFDISVEGMPDLVPVIAVAHVEVKSLEGTHVPLFLTMPAMKYAHDGPVRVHVVRTSSSPPDEIVTTLTFLGAKK
jgi:cytochrome c oxidase accessory protein FixG